jgi:hypothetical protein
MSTAGDPLGLAQAAEEVVRGLPGSGHRVELEAVRVLDDLMAPGEQVEGEVQEHEVFPSGFFS